MATSHTPCNLAANLKLNSFTKIQEYQKFSKKLIGFSGSFIWSLGVIRVKNWQSSIFRKMYFLENIQKFHQNLDFRLFPKVTPWCQIEVPPPQIINFCKFFQPGHSYPTLTHTILSPWAIAFWEKFHPTQAFKIYTGFV